MCCCYPTVRDEGRSLAIGVQTQVANRRKGLRSKARVLSVMEKGIVKDVSYEPRKMSTSFVFGSLSPLIRINVFVVPVKVGAH